MRYSMRLGMVRIVFIIIVLCSCFLPEVFGSDSENAVGQDRFAITGSEFYQRSQFDAGEIRIFLKNTSEVPLSVSQCKLTGFLPAENKSQNKAGTEINYLYSKLSPPVLMQGENGELLIKLIKTPQSHSIFECIIYDNTGGVSKTSVPIEQAPVWISYVGFSENLDKIYVYVRNNTQLPLEVKLLEVAGINISDNYHSINNKLPPDDKGCLIFKMPAPLVFGEYVHLTVSAKSADQEWQTHRIVRAVNRFPLLFENGSSDAKLGLDCEKFFITSTSSTTQVPCIQNMRCPDHAHGTHENAAREFLDNRCNVFLQNPCLLTQMWICRSDRPRAWYKFGPLPDIAVMNLVLSSDYENDTETPEKPYPFFWLGTMAKKATAPSRYLACVPLQPENAFFLKNAFTIDEIRFLVYCAVASGAKGILYRGNPSSDRLSRDAFVRLNKEVQLLKPLLMMAEPVNWAITTDSNYHAKSILCGDEAILIIVFDGRYFSAQNNKKMCTPIFEKSVKPVKIEVNVPEGLVVSEVKSLYAPLSKRLWNCQEDKLNFTAHMVDSVQVYKVVLTIPRSISSLGDISKPCENKETR
jgi:hypothetical protein